MLSLNKLVWKYTKSLGVAAKVSRGIEVALEEGERTAVKPSIHY